MTRYAGQDDSTPPPLTLGDVFDPAMGSGVSPNIVPGVDFYTQAKQQLGGVVDAAGDQALQTIGTWGASAQSAVMSYLGPITASPLVNTAVHGAMTIMQGGLTPQTFAAVAGLVATQVGGPVAGALAAGMISSVDAMAKGIVGAANAIGIPTAHAINRSGDFLCAEGWLKVGQNIPSGPADKGNGTWQSPGWHSSLDVMNLVGPCITCTGKPGAWMDASGWYPGPCGASKVPAIMNNYIAYSESQWLPWCELQSLPKDHFFWFYWPIVLANYDFLFNCSPMSPIGDQMLFKTAAAVWNAGHSSSSTVTFRPVQMPNYQFGQAIPSPITDAIQAVLSGSSVEPEMTPITVNTGPAVSSAAQVPPAQRRVIPLHIGGGTPQAQATFRATVANPLAAGQAATSSAAAPMTAGMQVLTVGALALGGFYLFKPALVRGWFSKLRLRG
jgi:hypothetical protein